MAVIKKRWLAAAHESGIRLDAFIREKLEGQLSAKKIKQAIEKNLCLVNGQVERFASRKVWHTDAIEFRLSEMGRVNKEAFVVEPARILYEDRYFFFYDKPSGLTSDASGLGSLFPLFPLVHRLDKETTGVIMLAKSEEAKQKLVEMFQEFTVKKSYAALVDGKVVKNKGVAESSIGRISPNKDQILFGSVPKKRGKWAKTFWEVAKKGTDASYLKCMPHTGRTHQIRVHLKELGHPILGDFQYAKKFCCRYDAKRCLLHAASVAFCHPYTGASLAVSAPLPFDFQQAIKVLFL